MKHKSLYLRVVVSVGILLGLFIYVSPERVVTAIHGADWRWMAAAVGLMPIFLLCRIGKWFVLVRQVEQSVRLRDIVPGYLWAMAVGKLTPGNIGEVARAWTFGTPSSQVGLFVLEKLLEVGCLIALCLLATIKLGVAPYLAIGATGLALLAIPTVLKVFARAIAHVLSRVVRSISSDKLDGVHWAIRRLRLGICVFLTLSCFLIFMTQVYLIMISMGHALDMRTLILFPVIMASNLIPITIGGFGLRESVAVFVLRSEAVPEAIAMSSFFFATVVDLFLPALLGITLHMVKGRAADRAKSSGASEEADSEEEAAQWDDFWEERRQRPIGKLISWVKSHMINPPLVRFIMENTERGTLIEAGCGTGEIAAQVAHQRGDRVILVDTSPQALMQAKCNVEAKGLTADVIEQDIAHLWERLGRVSDGSTFNIGVIEHFPDCSQILREMARVSGRYAVAMVPEYSIFWRCFIAISSRLGLVPAEFFIILYNKDKLRQVTVAAGLEVLAVRRTRILGVIPYLGIQFRNPSGAP